MIGKYCHISRQVAAAYKNTKKETENRTKNNIKADCMMR